MKARKTLAALGAALMMIGISAPASAFECEGNGNTFDPATIQENLTALAVALRCVNESTVNPGQWNPDNPIWEKRRSPSCETHDNLARNLFEEREFEPGTKPRRNKNNDAAGAAWNVRNGQFDAAILKLDSFIASVMKSRLNRNFDPDVGAAQMLANELVNEANEAKICIMQLLP